MNEVSKPILIESDGTISINEFFKINKENISEHLLRKGAMLFRGFPMIDSDQLEQLAENYAEKVMNHSVRLTHRKHVSGKINTTTEYNSDLKISLHTESSFCSEYPQKMFFYCLQPSSEQGETPLSDVTSVYKALNPVTREKFESKGVLYVRNFWPGFGPDWKTVFNVSSKVELEDYCKVNSIQVEWVDKDRPRISQKWPAMITHPKTGEKAWFNHATTSNLASVPEGLRSIIIDGFKKEDYPNNTYYGDGSEIEPEVITEINKAYDQFETATPWLKGDLVLVDNLRLAHGRNPYKGERKVIVAMIDPFFRKA